MKYDLQESLGTFEKLVIVELVCRKKCDLALKVIVNLKPSYYQRSVFEKKINMIFDVHNAITIQWRKALTRKYLLTYKSKYIFTINGRHWSVQKGKWHCLARSLFSHSFLHYLIAKGRKDI